MEEKHIAYNFIAFYQAYVYCDVGYIKLQPLGVDNRHRVVWVNALDMLMYDMDGQPVADFTPICGACMKHLKRDIELLEQNTI